MQRRRYDNGYFIIQLGNYDNDTNSLLNELFHQVISADKVVCFRLKSLNGLFEFASDLFIYYNLAAESNGIF